MRHTISSHRPLEFGGEKPLNIIEDKEVYKPTLIIQLQNKLPH